MTDIDSVQRNTSHENQVINNYLWFVVFFPPSLVIMVGNSIALAVFLRKTFRVKKSNYLLVNLTIADLLVGVSYAILSVMSISKYTIPLLGNDEQPYLVMLLLSVNVSIYTLSVISVERVLAVFWPFHHRLAQRWHYFAAIALVWILSFSPVLLDALTNRKLWSYYFHYTIVLIVLLTIFISYLSIWIKMKFFTKFRNCRTIQENSKLTKTLFVVTVVSLGTWLPKIIWNCVLGIYNPETKVNTILRFILTVLLVSNSFWNVIVYSVRIPEFRRELRLVFCKYL